MTTSAGAVAQTTADRAECAKLVHQGQGRVGFDGPRFLKLAGLARG
jgi:hypothetical protein